MALDETLSLDFSPALAGVDALGEAITATVTAGGIAISTSIADAIVSGGTAGVADLQASLSGLTASVAVTIDPTGLDEAIATVGSDAQPIVLNVDTSEVDAAGDELRNLAGDIVEAPFLVDTSAIDEVDAKLAELPTELTLDVAADSTGLDGVEAGLTDIETQIEDINTTTVSPQSDGSGLDDTSTSARSTASSLSAVEAGAAGAALQTGLLTDQAGSLAGSLTGAGGGFRAFATGSGLATLGGAAFVATTGSIIDSAIKAEASQKRFAISLGESKDRVLEMRDAVPGLDQPLSDLALKSGSSTSAFRDAISTYAVLGQQSDATSEQIAKGGQGLVQLALYASATNPKLGSAGDIIGTLGLQLSRGGARLARFGLDAGSAAERTGLATQLFGKSADNLSVFEKQTAGIQIALSKIGDENLAERVIGSFGTPLTQLRSLEVQIQRVAVEAGKPLISGLVSGLEELVGPATTVVKLFGELSGGAFTVIGLEVKLLGSILSGVAFILNNPFVSGLLAGAGAGTVLFKSLQLARSGASALADLGSKVATGLSNASNSVGAVRTGQGLSGAATALTGQATASRLASEAAVELEATQTALATTIAEATAQVTVGSEAWTLLTTAQSANDVAAARQIIQAEALITVREKQAAVIAAEAAAQDGSLASAQALVIAKQELAAAEAAETVAATASTAAQEEAATATAAAAATTVGAEAGVAEAAAANTVAMTVMTEAEIAAAAEAEALGAAVSATNPIFLAIAVVAGLAFGAYQLFAGGSDEVAEKVTKAGDAVKQYGDQLDVTGAQLANSSQDQLARNFQRADEAATSAKQAIKDAVDDDAVTTLEKYGISWDRVGEAIRGSNAAAIEVRKTLAEKGGTNEADVTIGDISTKDVLAAQVDGGGSKQAIEAVRAIKAAVIAEYEQSGDVDAAKEAGRKVGESYSQSVQNEIGLSGGFNNVGLDLGKAGEEIQAQIEAQQETVKSLAIGAEAQVKAGDASHISNLTSLAQIGALDQLNPKIREAADALLREAAAAEQDAAAKATLAGITDTTTRALAAQAFAGQAAIVAGQGPSASEVAAARALKASDGYDQLDTSVQAATDATLKYADASIQAAHDSGQLISETGELAIGMNELKSQLDTAADGFVNMLTKAQGLGSATRDVNKLLDEVVPTAKKLGTTLDETSASFNVGSINADNYTEYLRLLPKRVQDAIEGRNQAVKAAEEKRAKAAAETDKGESLIAIRFSAGEFVGGLTADGSADKAKEETKSAEQKAAETRAAIEANGDALAAVGRDARQNTRDLADFFDELGTAIRKEAAEMLKSGDSIDTVTKKIAERRDELVAQARQAGFTNDQILDLLGNERLLPDQVSIDLRESGVDRVVDAIERLGLVLSGLADIDPQVLRNIQGIQDPTKQVEAFNNAIASLPKEQQVKLRALFNVPETQVAAAEAKETAQRAIDSKSAIQLSIVGKADLDSALAAGDEIAAVIADIPLNVPIHVTADTVDAVAEFDATTNPRRKELEAVIASKADPATKATAQAELDKIAKAREALIKAFLDPTSLDNASRDLAAWAASQTIHFKGIVDVVPPVQSEFVTPTGDHEHQGGATPTVSAGSGAPVPKTPSRPNADTRNPDQTQVQADDVVTRIRRDFADLPVHDYTKEERGRDLPSIILDAIKRGDYNAIALQIRDRLVGGPARFFADGGVTTDQSKLRRRVAELSQPGVAQPGLYPPSAGDGFAFAEASTDGEYLISRDPAARDRNQGLVQLAAADLDVRLPQQQAPTLLLDRPTIAQPTIGGNNELAAAVAGLAAAIPGLAVGQSGTGPSRPGVNIEQLIVQAPDPDLRTSRATIEDVRTAVFTASDQPGDRVA